MKPWVQQTHGTGQGTVLTVSLYLLAHTFQKTHQAMDMNHHSLEHHGQLNVIHSQIRVCQV